MINAQSVSLDKIVKEDETGESWMVLSTCHTPSTELVNMETGEVCHFGDLGITAGRFTQTDEDLTEAGRHKAFDRMNSRRKGELIDTPDQLIVAKGLYDTGRVFPGAVVYEKDKPALASVHKLHVVSHDGELNRVKDMSSDPSREYLDMIAEELLKLTDLCIQGKLRGIAISYVTMEEDGNVYNQHNFITDGRGISALNTGIDLVKAYIVEAMRERFGVKPGE